MCQSTSTSRSGERERLVEYLHCCEKENLRGSWVDICMHACAFMYTSHVICEMMMMKTHKQDHYVCFGWKFVLPVLLLNKHVVERYMFKALQCNFVPKFNLLFSELSNYLIRFNLNIEDSIINVEEFSKQSIQAIPIILNSVGGVLGSFETQNWQTN